MQVCARLGLTLRAQLLDDERYVVLWPQPGGGAAGAAEGAGQTAGFVVDAYGGGDLLPVDEASPRCRPEAFYYWEACRTSS